MTKTRFTLKFSMGGAFACVGGLSALLLGFATYEVARSHFRENLRTKIQSIAVLSSGLIDPSEHQTIIDREQADSPQYLKIRGLLQMIQSANPEIRFIYTIRSEGGDLKFVVDAETKPELHSQPGDIYDDASASMFEYLRSKEAFFVEKEFTQDKWGTFLSAYAAIGDSSRGFDSIVGVDVDASFVLKAESDLAKVIAFCTLLAIVLVLLVSHYFSTKLSQSILVLTAEVKRIQSLNLNERPHFSSMIVEVDELGAALNAMKRGLKSFKKYVPSDLVNDLLTLGKEATLGTEKKTVTIMFSDIVDFTGISEKLSSEDLAACMAEYLGTITKIVKEHSGTVDKFIGDAVMVLWGAPHDCPNHAELACRAALACQKEIAALNQRLVAQGLPPLVTRIGLHSGEVVVGNIGTDERMSYTAIGDPVNLASRLEALNKYYGTGILVSESIRSSLPAEYMTRFVDQAVVKGKEEAVEIHELIGIRSESSPALIQAMDQYNEAMVAIVRGELERGLSSLKLLSRAYPQDPLIAFQLEAILCGDNAEEFHYKPRIMQHK